MVIAGEWYIAMNLLLDLCCLIAASRLCRKRASPSRLIVSAALGTLLSMTVLAFWGTRAGVFAALPIAALMALCAFGARQAPEGTMQLFVMAFFASGLSTLMQHLGLSLTAAIIACIPAIVYAGQLLARWRSRAGERKDVRLLFDTGGVTLDGMVDTGNLLRDPVTSLPVVVASYAALRAHLPQGMVCEDLQTLPRGFRLIGARTANGITLLMCFRPRGIYIRTGCIWRKTQAVVAVSPHLSGRRALLPPTLSM